MEVGELGSTAPAFPRLNKGRQRAEFGEITTRRELKRAQRMNDAGIWSSAGIALFTAVTAAQASTPHWVTAALAGLTALVAAVTGAYRPAAQVEVVKHLVDDWIRLEAHYDQAIQVAEDSAVEERDLWRSYPQLSLLGEIEADLRAAKAIDEAVWSQVRLVGATP